ncbi:hypothetical protein OC25_03700 [Pedobacter kyungheensis]|uniref:Uncharacterized protein n=2 Tax=Pedobacter TaxID=84567 RepID=A0A1G6K064_9SPHI|nr:MULTISPECIES: hypothetical protein [Pedobacter]KIA96198.1 hypothetical protein OC25_03700 [Pedobacter kyungheensis]SDC24412.1 hypothetical protein SAMN04488024_101613 [Pedobacter soli]
MKIWNIAFKRGTDGAAKALSGIHEGTFPVGGQNARPMNKNELSYRLANKILIGQNLVAGYLNAKTKGISKLRMKLFFACFLMLGGAYCLYLILSAVLNFLQ